ncbi:MAG TPA: hypothetical protein VM452_06955 [Caulifigura sp.]|jgi:hypothetical protein|nr:hypothetical protein [Caulifigura sp.]
MGIGRLVTCVLAAGVTQFLVGTLFHFGVPLVATSIPPQFANSNLFRPWEGWTSTYMVVHPFWFGAAFATVYLFLRSRQLVDRGWRHGLAYGAGVFVVGSLPVFLLVLASFQVSPEIIAAWVLQNACQYLLAGVVLGVVAKSAGQDSAS